MYDSRRSEAERKAQPSHKYPLGSSSVPGVQPGLGPNQKKKKKMADNNQLPYDLFSAGAKNFADYITYLFDCPKDYVIASMIEAVGVALGKRVTIFDGKYHNYPNLYVALVGRSGLNKSTPLSRCTNVLFNIEKSLTEKYKQDLEYVKAQNKQIKEDNKHRPAGEKQDYVEDPKQQQIILMDATPEKRNEVLSNIDDSPHSLLVYWDELPSMFKQFGRYNANSEMEDLMTFFDGRHYKVDRKSFGSMYIDKPVLSIIGTIQTGAIMSTFAKEGMLINGFNPRWLFVYPEVEVIPPRSRKQRNYDAEQWWQDFIVTQINSMQPSDQPLTITNAALDMYDQWCNDMRVISSKLQENIAEEQYQAAIYSKMEIQCVRWALISHFLSDRICEWNIDVPEMEFSIRCMEYFKRTALKIFTLLVPRTVNPSVNPVGQSVNQQRNQGVNPVNPGVNHVLSEKEMAIKSAIERAKKDGTNMTQLASVLNISRTMLYQYIRKFKLQNN